MVAFGQIYLVKVSSKSINCQMPGKWIYIGDHNERARESSVENPVVFTIQSGGALCFRHCRGFNTIHNPGRTEFNQLMHNYARLYFVSAQTFEVKRFFFVFPFDILSLRE